MICEGLVCPSLPSAKALNTHSAQLLHILRQTCSLTFEPWGAVACMCQSPILSLVCLANSYPLFRTHLQYIFLWKPFPTLWGRGDPTLDGAPQHSVLSKRTHHTDDSPFFLSCSLHSVSLCLLVIFLLTTNAQVTQNSSWWMPRKQQTKKKLIKNKNQHFTNGILSNNVTGCFPFFSMQYIKNRECKYDRINSTCT